MQISKKKDLFKYLYNFYHLNDFTVSSIETALKAKINNEKHFNKCSYLCIFSFSVFKKAAQFLFWKKSTNSPHNRHKRKGIFKQKKPFVVTKKRLFVGTRTKTKMFTQKRWYNIKCFQFRFNRL